MSMPDTLLMHEATVEPALRRLFDEHAQVQLPLYRMMQYQMGWLARDGTPEVGPMPARLHGALCIEAAVSTGGSECAADAGAAAELLYHSVQVHEQMQTSEGPSAERAAVWWVWGPAQAINVGDGLHAFARLAAFGLQGRGLSAERTVQAVAGLDAASLRYYEGQYLDLTYQERIDVTEAQYVRMVTSKRGALLGGAAALGARVAGASDVVAEAFRAFGESLGLAAQVRDDVAELWPANPEFMPTRVMNKSKLLPVVHALEHADVSHKRALGEVYFKRVMEPDDVASVRAVLDELGARPYAETKIAEATADALACLDGAGLADDVRERWAQVAAALTES